MSNDHAGTTAADGPIGLVLIDDPEGLAPAVAQILRKTARTIEGARPRGEHLERAQGSWPLTKATTAVGLPDLAGRPGRTITTIARGAFSRPALHITTQAVEGRRLTRMVPASYLLAVASIVEGGDGVPDARDLRRVAVASAMCDRHPGHERDLVVLHTGTAFEPVHLYDEGPRYTSRLESRILRAGEGLAPMMEALPRITRIAICRNAKGIPIVAIAPYTDKAIDAITEDDLELVGWNRQERADAMLA